MNATLKSATNQFQNNTLEKRLWLKIYQVLYQISKTEFEKTCTICYEISSKDSYCNCKIPTIGKRTDLKKFVDLYEFANNNIEDIITDNYIYIPPEGLEAFGELFKDDFVAKFKVQSTPKTEEDIQLEREAYIFNQGPLF
jgi:hypothetical protein